MNDKVKKILFCLLGIAIYVLLLYIGIHMPLLGALLSFPIYLTAKRSNSIIFSSILMGTMIGLVAYNFIPRGNYDLVRHWESAKMFENTHTFEHFWEVSSKVELEVLPRFYSWMIAKTGNYNLLQFFPVAIGYGMLFYILADYRKKMNLNIMKFIGVTILLIFGQSTLFYFSGLYNYFAINVFAFALYLDYTKGRRALPYMLYVIAPFIHTSLFLPLLLLIIFKIRKNRINIRFLIIIGITMLFFDRLLSLMAGQLNIDLLNIASRTYQAYISGNDRFMSLYDGWYLFMSVTKISFVLIVCFMQRGKERNNKICGFLMLLTETIIILSVSSIAMTRFSSLILFTALPPIIDVCRKNDKHSRLVAASAWALGVAYMIYDLHQILPLINIIR